MPATVKSGNREQPREAAKQLQNLDELIRDGERTVAEIRAAVG